MNKLIFTGLFFISVASSYAQKFVNIGVENGLSAHQAYNIVEDANGFFWVSTKDGIDRYNGETTLNYNISNPNNLGSHRRFKLTIDNSGDVWAYSNKEIYKFISGKNRFELKLNIEAAVGNPIVITHLDIKESFWICTSNGLYTYNNEDNSINKTSFFENQKIDLIFAFDKDKLLVALSDRLVFLDTLQNVSKTIIQIANKSRYSWIRSVFWDKNTNETWVGTRDGEVYVYDFVSNNTIKLKNKIPQLPSVPVNKIVALEGTIFIGSDGGGVFQIDKQRKTLIDNFREDEDDDQSLRGNGIQDMLVSSSKNLLVTTFTGGLNILDNRDEQFRVIKHELNNPNSLRNNVVNSLLEDVDGDMWFATNNGISCWLKSKNKWVNFLGDDKSGANVFLSLLQYDANSIMAGSYSNGLYIIDKRLGVVENIFPGRDNPNSSDSSDYIAHIFRDDKGKIWTGGPFKDLAVYDPKSKKHSYLPIRGLSAINKKDDVHIFIGTQSGLYIANINTLSFENVAVENFIPNNAFINSLNYDKDSATLWIATSNGIVAWNLGTNNYKILSKEDGMPSNHVYAILKHRDESLWASTEEGIVKYDMKTNDLENFSIRDGISDESFYKNSKLKCKDGNFYFGSYSGVTYFNPDNIKFKNNSAVLYFENLLINNRVIGVEDEASPLKTSLNKTQLLNLDYNQNSFSFDFTSIIQLGTSEVKYSWMLDNQDADWTMPSINKSANYTNLSAGDYVFKLRGIGNKNNEILDERFINVYINAAPWNTLWARILYFIVFISILYAAIRFNYTYNKKKLSEAKVKFFINTAHDIRTPLTLASAPLTDLQKSENLDKKDRYYLDLSVFSLTKLTESINQLLDFQKSDLGKIRLILSKVNVVDVVNSKVDYFSKIIEQKNISLKVVSELDELIAYVDVAKFDKILDNIMSNAYKYTQENGAIEVSLTSNQKSWSIEIKDTGIGISADAQRNVFKRFYRGNNAINSKITGTGIGLLLVRDYVQLHKGKVDIKSKEGIGTKLTITFLHGKKHYDSSVAFSEVSEVTSGIFSENQLIPAVETKSEKSKSKIKVLVVEDNDNLRDYLQNSLENYFTTKSVENGKIASEIAEKFMPDIIVSDVGMPELNGIELTKMLKSKFETSHIPVILLTAYNEKTHILNGFDSGADDYITKPFDSTLLLARIQNIISNRQLVKNRFLQLTENKVEESTYTNERDQEFVKRAMDFVEKNMMNPNLSKKFFASGMLVSQTLLYQKLKTLTGLSPNEFVKITRLRYAAKKLKENRYTISEVANLSGFSDSKYFSTCFKQFYGKSPSNF